MNAITVEIRKEAWSVTVMNRTHLGRTVHSSTLITGTQDSDKLDDLVDFIASKGLEGVGIAVVLPQELVLSRVIMVPAPNQEAIKGIVKFELEKHIPYQVSEVRYGFQNLGKEGDLYTVLITAVKKDALDNIVGQFEESKLKVVSVDSPQVSLFNALAHGKKLSLDGAFSLIYIRDDTTMIDTFVGCVPVDSRFVKGGTANREKYAGDLIRELRAVAAYVNASPWAKRPERLLLTGEMAVVDEVALMLNESTDLRVDTVNLSTLGIESYALPSFGLALEVLGKGKLTTDLMSTPDVRRMKATHRPTAVLSIIVIFLFISLGASYLLVDILTSKRYETFFREVEVETGNLRKSIAKLKSLKDRIVLLESAKGRSVPTALNILSELSSLLPSGTWLTSFEVKGDKIYINGLSDQASFLVLLLEKSRMVKDVEFLGQITKAVGGKERFRMKAVIIGGHKR